MLKLTAWLFIFIGALLAAQAVIDWYPYWEKSYSKLPGTIDRIVIHKSQRTLEVYSSGKLLRIYRVSLGRSPVGHKKEQGDRKTPEGQYWITAKNANSSFHLSLKISYPNKQDRKEAARFGRRVGSDIMIHGLSKKISFIGGFHRLQDWTLGCIAVTNTEIEEIYHFTPIGTLVEILP